MPAVARVVLDAEPLVAHADGERGSERVTEVLDEIATGAVDGFLSAVNATEVRYALARKYDRSVADEYLAWLDRLGVERRDVEDVWVGAAEFVIEHNPALGDAFALGTAEALDASLLAGGDAEYAGITAVPIERFRDGAG